MRFDRLGRAVSAMLVLLTIPAVARAQGDDVERRIQREWDRIDRQDARVRRLDEARVERSAQARERAYWQREAREQALTDRQLRAWDQQDRLRERQIELRDRVRDRQIELQDRVRQRQEDAAFRRVLRMRDRP